MHMEVALGHPTESFLACRVTEFDREELSIDFDLHLETVIIAKGTDYSARILDLALDEATQ